MFLTKEEYIFLTEGNRFTRSDKIKTGSLKWIFHKSKTEVKNVNIYFKN